mmetsp:Transcript_288/g.389  ORF Transcript_288/g.389 Transcript_288/m.389 type:complete len:196 (+) Transcript_288:2720-3307(+)
MTWTGVTDEIEEEYSASDYASEGGLYSAYLRSSDYFHLFSNNLAVVVVVAIVIVAIWGILAVFDRFNCFNRPSLRKLGLSSQRKEPLWNNFALRFYYELFLEFCICALVNIALPFSGSGSVSVQWFLSLAVLLGIATYIAWLLSLFCCNGPYLRGFYRSGTLVESLWAPRPYSSDFGATGKAAQKRAKKLKALKK